VILPPAYRRWDRGPGRMELRTRRTSSALHGYPPSPSGTGLPPRPADQQPLGRQPRRETAYAITSRSPQPAGPERLLQPARGQRESETRLHRVGVPLAMRTARAGHLAQPGDASLPPGGLRQHGRRTEGWCLRLLRSAGAGRFPPANRGAGPQDRGAPIEACANSGQGPPSMTSAARSRAKLPDYSRKR